MKKIFSPAVLQGLLIGTGAIVLIAFILLIITLPPSNQKEARHLANSLPAKKTVLYIAAEAGDEWETFWSWIGQFDVDPIPAEKTPSNSGLREIAIVRSQDGEEYHWIMQQERGTGTALLTSAKAGTQSLLLTQESTEPAFADLPIWQRYNAGGLPNALFVSTAHLPSSDILIEGIITSLLAPFSYTGIAWDSDMRRGALYAQKRESSAALRSVTPSIVPVHDDADLVMRIAEPHVFAANIAERTAALNEGLEQGVRGILLQAWKDAVGDNSDMASDLGSLTANPATLEVWTESGGATAVRLAGTAETGSLILQHMKESASRSEIRTTSLLRGIERKDVIASGLQGMQENTIDGWTMYTAQVSSGTSITYALKGNSYALTNDPLVFERETKGKRITFPEPDRQSAVRAIGKIRIAWLLETLRTHLPFLLPQEGKKTIFPWHIFKPIDVAAWTVSETNMLQSVQWESL